MSHALIGLIAIFFTLGTYFGINYAKFQTFDGVPVKYYGLYQKYPERMIATGGKQIHVENLPTGLASYFLAPVRFRSEFPRASRLRTAAAIRRRALRRAADFRQAVGYVQG